MRHTALPAIALVVGLSWWIGSTRATEDERVALIRDANRNSVQGIRTIHAKYTTLQQPVGGKKGSGQRRLTKTEWWQDGELIRWVSITEYPDFAAAKKTHGKPVLPPHSRLEGAVKGGEMRVQTKERDGKGNWNTTSGTIKRYSRDEVIGWDIWLVALVVIQTEPRATLADLLGSGAKVKRLPSEVVDKHNCDRLLVKSLTSKFQYEYDVLVDSRYNYLVRRLRPLSSFPGLVARFETSVSRFQECAPGVYFPADVETRGFVIKAGHKDEMRSVTRHTFTQVEVNRPIDPTVFHLEFTPGTSIWDQRNQTSYIIGKDQKPASPVEAMPVGGDKVAEPTYNEPETSWVRPRTAFAVMSTVAALGVGAWWLLRRRRRVLNAPGA